MPEDVVKEPEEAPEESSPPEEPQEKSVPYSRFKEVNDQLRELKDSIKSLETQKREGTLSDDDKRELDAKKYLERLMEETLEKKEREKKAAEEEEFHQFNEAVDKALDAAPSVKRSDFLKFLEDEGDDYATVEAAMRQYRKRLDLTEKAKESAKDDLKKKPGLPAHEGGTPKTYEADKGKTLAQIAEEAIRSLGK